MATDETLNDAWGALPEEVRYKLAVARCGTRKEDRNRAINDAVLGMSAALAAAEARGVEKQRARTTIVLRVLYRALREDAAAMVKRLDDAAFDTYATGATEGSDV